MYKRTKRLTSISVSVSFKTRNTDLFFKMFKLVVLFALVAVAVAKPSHLGLAYSSIVAPVAAVPASVSHTFRSDLISKPVLTAYAAAPAVVAAPLLHRTVVAAPLAVPAAVSHSYRSDVISKPLVATYAAPALTYAAHVPAIHAW